MRKYRIQITDNALSDMEEIYYYIAKQLQAPEAAMRQYNRIAYAIETLDTFPERVKVMEPEGECALGLRQMPVDSFSVFFRISGETVTITTVLYSASDINKRLRDS